MPDRPSPEEPQDALAATEGLGLEALLRLLERLDGAEEAAVVRGALAAGVSDVVVLEELRREVRRRLTHTRSFYDQAQW